VDIVKAFSEFANLGAEWVLWLLVILSVVSIAVILERMVFFHRIKIDAAQFQADLQKYLAKNDLEGVRNICMNKNSVECQAVLRALEVQDRGNGAIEQAVSGFLMTERHNLDRGLVILGTLGNNAPFVGLFGTVIGIIVAFKDLSLNTTSGASAVMAGISEALVATAVGLIVAIPAVVAYNGFQRQVRKHIANAEAATKTVAAHLVD
jgi:biopolymer transport protein ExbB/TolQ